MANVTERASNARTQMCANAGESDASQYLSRASVITETIVKKTRMKQYWNMPVSIVSCHATFSQVHSYQLTNPNHIEPGQPTSRLPQKALILPSSTLLQTKDTPEPILRHNSTKVLFLIMQRRRTIMTQQRKERTDRKCLIAIP